MAELAQALTATGAVVTPVDGGVDVAGLTAGQIGDAAAENGIAVHELTPLQASLEEAFMDLTRDSVEFHATEAGASTAGATA